MGQDVDGGEPKYCRYPVTQQPTGYAAIADLVGGVKEQPEKEAAETPTEKELPVHLL